MQLALHEGDIEWDIPLINITMDEESVCVDSNDKIIIVSATEINIGKTEDLGEETKDISIVAEDLLTAKVTSTQSVIELDEYNKFHPMANTIYSGSNKHLRR